jgi:anhydro-N-acetylmuramic acid kinase
MSPQLYIGLMSGTSLDGVDAILADFRAPEPVLASHHLRFEPALKDALWALLQPGFDEIARAAAASRSLSGCYAQAIRELLQAAMVERAAVRAVGCHGQTIRHNPDQGYSVQAVNGALLAELSGICVVCDFRSRDLAAGGQGAPLVPAFHAAAFRHPRLDRVIVNLGGIANLTYLPASGSVLGFDCGPANALLDEWSMAKRGLAFDAGGAWSAAGHVLPELLTALLDHPFFARPPPKSTGRETFNLAWATPFLQPGYADEDVQATFAELTARDVAGAIARWPGHVDETYLCGGGARNADLAARISRLLGPVPVATTAVLGVDPSRVEALAFAWLARERIEERPGNLAEATGAAGPRSLGCVYLA